MQALYTYEISNEQGVPKKKGYVIFNKPFFWTWQKAIEKSLIEAFKDEDISELKVPLITFFIKL